ncbi:lamin tail domain-containing protein [Pedobacter sp. KR3-3]|uniref:Lamin tail domain-containing protein n=1 Tax=Pedobacter albus TaxID=3113905 RepID=A0ABU7ICK5_9SPHI|nr:lamin tail domain-containing protein [Pedobacter sp. KR3-3]MEE1947176.1 lamin tail domain-containing protein [Pedobacter sp. KR3-3]
MRKTLLFFMMLSAKLAFGQVFDDFSDGNFTSNPAWTGQTNAFRVNSSNQLQTSLSAVAQTVMLAVPSALATNAKWEFFVQLNFDPSTANQARIYLVADQQDLNGPLNGYFIQIGENGSADSYDLYRQAGTTVTKIIDGPAKSRADVNKLLARVKVTRTDEGLWELYTDISGGTNYNLEGSATDKVFLYGDWFGVSCRYTATRSEGFIFDDFKVDELVPDVSPPTLLSAKALDDKTIEAVFSERLMIGSALATGNYAITNLGSPALVKATALPNVYQLVYASALPTGNYTLTVNGVKDLKGNTIARANQASFIYVQPYEFQKGDILISEILVNPKKDGVDFIEIYNATNQLLDLKNLQLANADANGNPANVRNVSNVSLLMPAKTYWVLTTNPDVVKAQYQANFPAQFVKMASLPAFNNDKGTVILLSSLKMIDKLVYHEDMHLALLRNADGVSLERVSFAKPTDEAGNFKSAAASVGFATPTYRNSQEDDKQILANSVSLGSKTFSPDGDGFEDQLQIDYRFVNNGQLANVNIYSDKGILVRKLQRNTSIATSGNFIWDGTNDNGQRSKVGIYVVQFDTFALNGKRESFRRACVLATKLN